ncbi:MAG: carboxypeptidase regulatory-like domain-containing protein [Gemmatimonadota bacterium]
MTGTVLGSGGVLAGSIVSIAGTVAGATTDPRGQFTLVALKGRRFLHVRAIGYEPYDTLLVVTQPAYSLNIQLRRLPVFLDSVKITANATGKPARYANTGKFDEFYERKATAIGGTFFTREEIERADRSDAIELLRTIPGVEFTMRSGQPPIFRFARCQATPHNAFAGSGKADLLAPNGSEFRGTFQLFIDGMKVGDPLATLAQLKTSEIEAMELYRGVAQLPEKARGDGCAAIFVWTRYSSGSVLERERP